MNLDTRPRNDYVAVDPNLNPPGTILQDLLGDRTFEVTTSASGIACIHVPLEPRQMVILKSTGSAAQAAPAPVGAS